MNLLPQAGQNLVLAGAILSIMLNPVLFALLEKYLAKTETLEEQTLEEAIEEEKQIPVDICNHGNLFTAIRLSNRCKITTSICCFLV